MTTTPTAPTTTEIRILAGTIVGRGTNRNGKVDWDTVELLGDVFVQASRMEDGAWGYTLEGDRKHVYICAGGLGIPV